ncbi:MAG: sodium:alanine symporter family protein [Alphaproteobacteria bacterium TMED87]|nr:sodium:alanine symporter family protein [Rhodospirillaceae bacterium]OUV08459.1 MAG: sodium:alanine symporter family protein [Alphaproteobacteria bacterium TMED87]
METFEIFLNVISQNIWMFMMFPLLGIGFYLTFGLRLITIIKIPSSFANLFDRDTNQETQASGEISPFKALMTALAATVGTGNIAGVATAIFLGGPGAIFWMWMTALFGMATKYSEALLAVHYREKNAKGNFVGGPMYYIKNGLGKKWQWLGFCFSFLAIFAGLGAGNTVQSNSIADVLYSNLNVPHWLTGVTILLLVAAVLIGGVKRIASVAGKLVPIMIIAYLTTTILILITNFDEIPDAFSLIFLDAFSGTAAAGGFAGATVMAAIRFGVARGIFSNEAGLGSAPIAHAAAKTNDPVKQGRIGMLGTFIDTILVCTMTALVIIITGSWTSGENGATLTATAFSSALPYGNYIVMISLIIFAFTTILGWSYYGERCAEFIFGQRSIIPFRIIWCAVIPIGAITGLEIIWLMADIMNALMAIPNLIALFLLSPVVFKISKEYNKE